MATEIGRLVAVIDGDISPLQRAIGNAAKTLQGAGRTMQQAGQSLTLGLTAPIVGIGAIAAKASIDFESAFAGVRKTVDATVEELDKLRLGIRGMAREMPESAVGIARVAEAAGQLGIKTENILEFTRVMVMLGETTNLTADEAATAMARLANIMGTPQDQFEKLGATLVDLGNKGASTEAEIVEMALRIAGAGEQIGLTEAEVLAFANALSSVGINAEAGGSAISRSFIEVANAVASGGKELQGFAAVAGMSIEQFSQAFRDDPAQAMIAFITGLERISQEGQNTFQVLDDLGLGEIRVRDALLRAANAGDLFAQSIRDGEAAWESGTALATEYGKRVDTTAARLEIFKNRLMDSAITLGDALVPAMMAALVAAEPLMQGIAILANGFASLPSSIQTVIVVMAALAAILGPMLMVIGSISTGFGAIIKVLTLLKVVGPAASFSITGLSASFGALILAALPWIALAAAIAAGLYLLIKNWDAVSAAVTRAAFAVRDVVVNAFNTVLNFLSNNWREVAPLVAGPFLPLVALATDAFGIRTALVNAFREIIDFMRSVPSMIAGALGDMSGLLSRAGQAIIRGLWVGMAEEAKAMLNWISGLAKQIANLKGPLQDDRRLLVPAGEAIMEGLGTGLNRGFRAQVQPALQGISASISPTLQKYLDDFRKLGEGAIPNLGENDPINIEATEALLKLDPEAFGDPSKVLGFRKTLAALATALQKSVETGNEIVASNGMTWKQINAMPDEWRMANSEMIKELGDTLGYKVFEDMSIAGPGTAAFDGGTGGTTGTLGGGKSSGGLKPADELSKSLSSIGDSAGEAGEAGSQAMDNIGQSAKQTSSQLKKTAEDFTAVPDDFYDKMDTEPVEGVTESVDKLSGSVKGLKKEAETAGEKFDWLDEVKSSIGETSEKTVDWKSTLEEVPPAVEGVGEAVESQKRPVKEFSGVWESSMMTMRDAADFASGLFNKIDFGSAADAVSNAFSGVEDAVSGAFDGAKTWVSEALAGVGDAIAAEFTDTKSDVSKALSGVGSAIAAEFSDTKNDVSRAVSGIKETITGAFNSAKEAALSGVENVVNAIVENFTAENLGRAFAWFLLWPAFMFKRAFDAVFPTLTTFFTQTLPEFFTQQLPALATSLAGTFQQVGAEAINGLVSGFSSGMSTLTTFFTEAFNGIITGVGSSLQTLGTLFMTFFTVTLPGFFLQTLPTLVAQLTMMGVQLITGLVTGLSQGLVAAATFFNVTLPSLIISSGASAIGAATQLGISIVNGIAQGLSSAGTAIANFFTNTLPSFFNNAIASLQTTGMRIGRAIVEGIASGLSAAAGWLATQAASFARGFASEIETQLGIAFSNAAVWLAVAGSNLVAGLWNGIASRASWLLAQVLKLAQAIYNKVKEGLGNLWPFSPSEAGVDVAVGFGLGLMAGLPSALAQAMQWSRAMQNALTIPTPAYEAMLPKPAMPRVPWGDIDTMFGIASRGEGGNSGGLTIQAYDTVVNNFDEMQDVNKALADLAFAAQAEMRLRGR